MWVLDDDVVLAWSKVVVGEACQWFSQCAVDLNQKNASYVVGEELGLLLF